MDKEDLQVETIKTYVQLTGDDAKSVLLYGSIAVGLLVFTLPQLLVFTISSECYWIFLFLGVGGLLLSSCIFFWYSRQLTRINYKHGDLLLDITTNSEKIDFREKMNEIRLFRKEHVRFLINLAKIFGGLGSLSYLVAIIMFLIKKL